MKNLVFLSALFTLIVFSSCKKCDASNSTDGIIIEDAIVKVLSVDHNGQLFISDGSEINASIQMSLDGGVTYTDVDYSRYSVFGLRTTSSCSSGYHRSVSVDTAKAIANYTITINECSTCEHTVTTDNWVLTSKVPGNYTAVFNIK